MSTELMPKRFELLSELVPQVRLIALLVNPSNANAERIMRDVQEAARTKGVQLHILRAGTESEIDAAFASLVELHAGALVVGNDPFFNNRREQLVALASRHAVPAIYEWREFTVAGIDGAATKMSGRRALAGRDADRMPLRPALRFPGPSLIGPRIIKFAPCSGEILPSSGRIISLLAKLGKFCCKCLIRPDGDPVFWRSGQAFFGLPSISDHREFGAVAVGRGSLGVPASSRPRAVAADLAARGGRPSRSLRAPRIRRSKVICPAQTRVDGAGRAALSGAISSARTTGAETCHRSHSVGCSSRC